MFSWTVAPKEGSPVKSLKVGGMKTYILVLGRGPELSKLSAKAVKLVNRKPST